MKDKESVAKEREINILEMANEYMQSLKTTEEKWMWFSYTRLKHQESEFQLKFVLGIKG